MVYWVCLFLLFVVGCVPGHSDKSLVKLLGSPFHLKIENSAGYLITASFDGATFEDVVLQLPENISVCVDEEVRFSRFSIDVVDVDIDTYLFSVCRSAGCKLERYGDLYVFSGKGKDSSSGKSGIIGGDIQTSSGANNSYIVYMRFPYYKVEEVLKSVGGCGCSAQFVSGDRYIIKGDVGSIVRIREFQRQMMLSLPCEYAFDLWICSKDYLLSADVGLSLGGSGGYNISKMAGEMVSYDWSYVINVLSSANLERTNGDYVRHISGVFRESSGYKVTVGDSVPYVKRAMTDSGASVDTGVEYTDIGFSLDLSLQGEQMGICKLNMSFNDIGGYVQGYPIKHGSTLTDEFCISGDNKRFVGSFLVDGYTRSLIGYTRKRSEWLVFIRVLRVSAGQTIEYAQK